MFNFRKFLAKISSDWCLFPWTLWEGHVLKSSLAVFIQRCHRHKSNHDCLCLSFFKKIRFYLFIFREQEREAERERNNHVWLPLRWPLLGTCPATQACALTEKGTGDPLVRRTALNQSTEPHQAGLGCLFHSNF